MAAEMHFSLNFTLKIALLGFVRFELDVCVCVCAHLFFKK